MIDSRFYAHISPKSIYLMWMECSSPEYKMMWEFFRPCVCGFMFFFLCLEHVQHGTNYSCSLIRPLYAHDSYMKFLFWYENMRMDIRFGREVARENCSYNSVWYRRKEISPYFVWCLIFFFCRSHVLSTIVLQYVCCCVVCLSGASNLIEKLYNLN